MKDASGRQAWVVYCITGYSFTMVEVSYLGAAASQDGARALLYGMGWYADLA